MSVTQLIYVSRRTKQLTLNELEQIVIASEIANRHRNVTGVLLCCGIGIMQLLEGDASVVIGLAEKIQRDPRHTQVEVLVNKTVGRRLFPEWGMGMVDLDRKVNIDRERLMRLVNDVRAVHNTSNLAVEARVLLSDFRQQLDAA